jgi:hypothetical protein
VGILGHVSLSLFAVHFVPDSSVSPVSRLDKAQGRRAEPDKNLLVAPYKVIVSDDKHHQTPCRKCNKNLVAGAVQGFVIISVNLWQWLAQ